MREEKKILGGFIAPRIKTFGVVPGKKMACFGEEIFKLAQRRNQDLKILIKFHKIQAKSFKFKSFNLMFLTGNQNLWISLKLLKNSKVESFLFKIRCFFLILHPISKILNVFYSLSINL